MTQSVEVPWVDAWIRWERNSKQDDDHSDCNLDDDESLPPPTESYNFTHTLPGKTLTLQIEGYHSDSEQTWNSTGLTLWRSSYYLCQYLVDNYRDLMQPEDDVSGTDCQDSLRILEVGSGLGRCGMLAHLLSKANGNYTQTTLTDGDTDTLKLLRQNARNNIKDDNIECKQLLWGESHALKLMQQQREQGNGKFDLIIGSDLLYVTSVIQPLFETVFEVLKPTCGTFLMAHCCRRVGNEVTLDEILNISRNMGFRCKEEFKNEEEDIVLFSFKLSTE